MPGLIPLVSDVRGGSTNADYFFPLSTMAIGTALKAAGRRPVIIDAQVEPNWRQVLSEALPESTMLGVSCLTGPSVAAALDAVELARSEAPELPVVWGGYHATLDFRAILQERVADFVVLGPGERTVTALASVFDLPPGPGRSAALANIAGLAYRDQDRIVVNAQAKLGDLNALPPMDYTLVDVERYFRDRRTIHYVSSYGCTHACAFCAEPTQNLRRWRGFGAKRIADEVSDLVSRYRADRIFFQDPNFSSDPRRVVDFVRELRSRSILVDMLCDMRAADIVSMSRLIDLRELYDAGLRTIYIGVESGSDAVLRSLRKGSTAECSRQACRLLDAAGITAMAGFIHDLPDETETDSELTLALAEELCELEHCTQSHHFYTPYPMTELYQRLTARGAIAATSRQQRDWALSSTFWGSDDWSGRPDFRRRVLRRLLGLHRRYPQVISRDMLPVLRLVRA